MLVNKDKFYILRSGYEPSTIMTTNLEIYDPSDETLIKTDKVIQITITWSSSPQIEFQNTIWFQAWQYDQYLIYKFDRTTEEYTKVYGSFD